MGACHLSGLRLTAKVTSMGTDVCQKPAVPLPLLSVPFSGA